MAFPMVTTSRGDEAMSGDSSAHPLAFLIGVWIGEGKAEYPGTIDFGYGEELTIAQPPGRPVLSYIQKTWSLTDGSLTHAEIGYLRAPSQGRVELLLAHPTGHVEVEEGSIEGGTIRTATTGVARSASSKEVTALDREISVEGDVLRYHVRMAATGHDLSTHLTGVLHRR